MKKTFSIFILITIIFTMAFTTGCSAGDITVTLNGNELALEQSPVIVDGRTLVPFRGIFEALGAEVSWEESTREVTGILEDKKVALTIDSDAAYVNGEKKILDVPPQIINDYTMVPVRFVSESLGADVQWDASSRTVKILFKSNLTAVFVDVGQGDCQLIICDGKTMLIDGGTADKSRTVVAVLKKYGVEYIDYVVATHAHADHCGGLSGALNNFKVGAVLAPETGADSKVYSDFVAGVAAQGLEIINPKPGYTFSLGGGNVVVLGPVDEASSDLNDTSIVLKITYGSKSFLFTGDCDYSEEHDILETGVDLSADVLKVGHHGSETATSYTFLREVMPRYAIIGVGKDNSYGHPTEETLSRLRDVGATIYRTDLQGDIVVTSDGNILNIATYKNQNIQTNPTQGPVTEEASYIGNSRSKKLHKTTCSGLPDEQNRTYFTARADAINDGYTPCKICNP